MFEQVFAFSVFAFVFAECLAERKQVHTLNPPSFINGEQGSTFSKLMEIGVLKCLPEKEGKVNWGEQECLEVGAAILCGGFSGDFS